MSDHEITLLLQQLEGLNTRVTALEKALESYHKGVVEAIKASSEALLEELKNKTSKRQIM